jgi:hypothetical protein
MKDKPLPFRKKVKGVNLFKNVFDKNCEIVANGRKEMGNR